MLTNGDKHRNYQSSIFSAVAKVVAIPFESSKIALINNRYFQSAGKPNIRQLLISFCIRLLVWGAVLWGLILARQYHFLLFHSLAEISSIAVALATFMLVWNIRKSLDNSYLLIVGVAYLFVGFFDMAHTIAYHGMVPFNRNEINLQNQLWIAGRYLESLSLLLGLFFIGRRLKVEFVLVGLIAATSTIFGTIFYWEVFPTVFVEGLGATPFMKLSLFIIIVILISAIIGLKKKSAYFDPTCLRYLLASVIFTIVSELCFASFKGIAGTTFLFGHFFKIVSYYFIYKAIIEMGATKPIKVLFRNLEENEKSLRLERDFISGVLSTAGSLVIVIDREGRIRRFNRACERLTGYSFEEMAGKVLWDLLLLPNEAANIRNIFQQLDRYNVPISNKNFIVAKDGTRYLISWSDTGLRGSDGTIEYLILTGIDITESNRARSALRKARKKLEQRVQERTAELAEVNEQLVQQIKECRRVEDELRLSEMQLKSLSSQLLTAQESERRRISRELHDELGGSLAVLKLRVGAIEKKLLDDQEPLKEESRLISHYLDQLNENVHRLSRDLCPSILEDLGLTPALRWLINNFVRHTGILVTVNIENVDNLLSMDEQIILYRTIQESLTNISKHAQALEVLIELSRVDGRIFIMIEDNGRGFDTASLDASNILEKGLGLAIMQERARMLGGTLQLNSQPGKGLRISLNFPLKKEEKV